MIDPALYPFFSILHASSEIKTVASEKKLTSWLMNLEKPSDDYILDSLRLQKTASPEKIQRRQAIAAIYAKVLAEYVPDGGIVHNLFNYVQLVEVIKAIFNTHLNYNLHLFNKGVARVFPEITFYAKVELGRPYIIAGLGEYINKGRHGIVSEVFEITSRQFLALKKSNEAENSIKCFYSEIANLNLLHKIAAERFLSVEGIQPPPIAVFDGSFKGYLGLKYGIDLETWIFEDCTKAERIAVCKSIMCAYKNMLKIGIWHGDLKLKNILINNNGVIIIDWAGSILYKDAIDKKRMPFAMTRKYINFDDLQRVFEIPDNQDAAHAMELYSIAICLFQILVSEYPFSSIVIGNYPHPNTIEGIARDSMGSFERMSYNPKLITIMEKMLAHDYKERYTSSEAIKLWEKI